MTAWTIWRGSYVNSHHPQVFLVFPWPQHKFFLPQDTQ
jgi:hypothetical protein